MFDARLNFDSQVEYVSAKASVVKTILLDWCLKLDALQSRIILLLAVVTAVFAYGIYWLMLSKLKKIAEVGRTYISSESLIVACAFRTISKKAECAISGILPLLVLAEKWRTVYKDINNWVLKYWEQQDGRTALTMRCCIVSFETSQFD